ncbi:hypothetical protein [Halomonas alimentaria]|uniref:hypothetical protein n=1 Tax=Halomonas alimentaria TaxID=147248 RepID=UPI00248FCBBB|nr:hypothetical protein [Halomonas alimentaria]
MSHLAQTTTDQRQGSTTLARLAALDLTQDDIVRPELRDDAILSDRTQRVGRKDHNHRGAHLSRTAGRVAQ